MLSAFLTSLEPDNVSTT